MHELTEHLDLSMFAMFSSAAGVLGASGQGNYAAANAFLDALAEYRHSRGLPATSIAWGYWEQTSEMTSGLGETDLARMARHGVLALSAQEGLELFDTARGTSDALLVAARMDSRVLRAGARAGMLPPMLQGLVRAHANRAAGTGSLARRLASLPDTEREGLVLEVVRSEVAVVLGHSSPNIIDPDRAFKDLGFDSLTAVELRNRLNTITGLRLPATLVFDYPNSTLIARYLLEQIVGTGSNARVGTDDREVRKALESIPLARLREVGLLDILLQLANPSDASQVEPVDKAGMIDHMDVESLVQTAMSQSGRGV
jgi:acyl carrier protein